MALCDLHTHTTASDGSDSPRELVRKAKAVGLRAVAITDHDTTQGLMVARAEGERQGIEMIPGVELSVLSDKGNMHILAYFVEHGESALEAVLHRVQRARAERNPKMVAKLNDLGVPITMEMLEEMAKGGQVGRPHFARALVSLGVVKNVQEAFDRFLKRGAKAYVPKSILSPIEAIEAIRKAGALSVLAHPFSLKCSSLEELRAIVEGLASSGLDGIECYYSEHSEAFTKELIEMATSLGLVVTGGTDYHGKAKPYIELGRGKGGLSIPYSCVEALKERLKERIGERLQEKNIHA